jgi:lysophospholipase L1-like esterase
MFRLNNLSRVAALGALLALAACDTDKDVVGVRTPPGGDLFKSYVAIGNSITAGYQSSGINDSTQRQSYARLLAMQMGTTYHYAALAMPGCPPPVANTATGARVGAGTSTTCALRTTSSVTDYLNNVAVPGARVLDPTTGSTVASNALTTFILGGMTQVQRALQARPTFATIWIGNNDVLEAGASGILVPVPGISPGIVSTQEQFEANYDAMIQQLTAGAPGIKGVLIGVVQVAGIPLLQQGAIVFANQAAVAQVFLQATGKAVTVNPNCNGSTALVSLPQLIPVIRAGTHPPTISCVKGSDPTNPLVGDLFVLDPTEQQTLGAAIAGYNDYIQSKADEIGFAYYDPNVLLAAKKASGEIPPFPNFASTSATFGPFISLDGVHPSGAAHKVIANDLIGVINAEYGTSLQPVQ